MITAEQVKNLNKKIEGLNAQGNRAKAKLEVLEGNLTQSLEDYKSSYGVDLRGKSMKTTADNIQKELLAVEADVQREFELREAVVAAIESGDIEEANRLLGVTVVEEDDEEEVEETPEIEDIIDEIEESPISGSSDVENDFGIDTAEDTEEPSFEEDLSDDDSFDLDGLDFGDLDLSEEEEPAKPEPAKPQNKKSSNIGSTVEDTVQSLEGVPNGFEDFDFGSDDFEDFGFNELLAGTKFGDDE